MISISTRLPLAGEKDFSIDNLLVRIRFIIKIIWSTGLAPWEFEFLFPGSLISTFLGLTAEVDGQEVDT